MFLPPKLLRAGSGPRRVPGTASPPWALLSSARGSSVAPCGHPSESSGGGHLSLSISSSFTMVGQGGAELELKFFKVASGFDLLLSLVGHPRPLLPVTLPLSRRP